MLLASYTASLQLWLNMLHYFEWNWKAIHTHVQFVFATFEKASQSRDCCKTSCYFQTKLIVSIIDVCSIVETRNQGFPQNFRSLTALPLHSRFLGRILTFFWIGAFINLFTRVFPAPGQKFPRSYVLFSNFLAFCRYSPWMQRNSPSTPGHTSGGFLALGTLNID